MTDQYIDELLITLDEAVEKEAVSHELYEFLMLKHFNQYGSRAMTDIALYKAMIRSAIRKKEFKAYTPLDHNFLSDAQDSNMPLYTEYIALYCKYVKLARSGVKKTKEPKNTYEQMRVKIARKYSSISAPEPTRKLNTKEMKEYKKIPKWKSGVIDDIARIMVELEKFEMQEVA